MNVQIKRAYAPTSDSDGTRVLVDRLWPRGIAKEKLAAEEWMKAVAPSTELRKWFAHDPQKWLEFKRCYAQELGRGEQNVALQKLSEYALKGRLTLVYAARDEQHNHAVVIKEMLQSR